MNPPKGITSSKAPVVHDAHCTEPGCCFWQQDRGAQQAARDHARSTGHTASCMTMVEYTYAPASRAEREDPA